MTEVSSLHVPSDDDVEQQLSLPSLYIGDLIAYEFLDLMTRAWRCELATVVGSTTSRTVQVERLTQDVRDSDGEIVANTEEGRQILEELQEMQKEHAKRMEESDRRLEEIRDKRTAFLMKQREVEKAMERAHQELGDVRTAVKKIDMRQWRELVSYRTPPDIVVRVMSAVMLIMGERRHTWTDMQPLLHRPTFIQHLAHFEPKDVNAINRQEVIQRYINSSRFTYEEAVKGSQAIGQIYRWVMAHVQVVDASTKYQEMRCTQADEYSKLENIEAQLEEERASIAAMGDDIDIMWERFNEVERDNEASPVHSINSSTIMDENVDPISNSSRNATRQSVSGSSGDATAYTVVMRQLTTRPWRYSRSHEQRIILHSSVLCNFGPAPPTTSHIVLTEEQCKLLHAAARAREQQHSPLPSQRETSTMREDSALDENSDVKSPKRSREEVQRRTEGYRNQENVHSPNVKSPKHGSPRQLQRIEEAKAVVERQLKESEEAKAAVERQLKESEEARAKLERKLQKTTETESAIDRQLRETDEAKAVVERQLRETDEAKAVVERQLRESEEAKAAVERQLKESEEARAELERKLQKTTETESATDRQLRETDEAKAVVERQLKESEESKKRLESQVKELEKMCMYYKSNAPRESINGIDSPALEATGKRRDSSYPQSGGNVFGPALERVRSGLLRIDDDLNNCVKSISKMVSDDKESEILNHLLSLTGEESQSGDGRGTVTPVASEKALHSAAHDFKREVLRMTKALSQRDEESRRMESRLDDIRNELSSIEEAIEEQRQEYQQNSPEDVQLLKQLQEKQETLVAKLSSIQQNLMEMRESQQQRQQEFLRKLQEYSPGLVEAYMQKTFGSEWWETGALSATVGAVLTFAVGSLLYKQYELC